MKLFNHIFISISIMLVISSCAFPHYQHSYESTKGLDLRNGKWLINNIETDLPYYSKEHLTKNLIKKFEKIVGDSVVYIDSISLKYILPSQMKFELSSETLMSLKNTTDFDYVLNVRGDIIRDELGSVIINPYYSDETNESEVYIDVYEVSSGQRIYSQRIVASVSMNENNEKVQFSKSASALVFSALKKGLKKVKKYSIKN